MNEAIAILPLKSALSFGEKFRFAKGAAQALLGKVYLYQGKAPEAASILAEVIISGEYDLEPNVADVWSVDKEFGIEYPIGDHSEAWNTVLIHYDYALRKILEIIRAK